MRVTLAFSLIAVLAALNAHAQQQERPPAQVTVSSISTGTIAPTTGLDGNVYFKEVSQVATEVTGKVIEVNFEEGQHLDAGSVLVRLDYSLLEPQLARARALTQAAQTNLQLERVRLNRAEELLRDEITTPQEYDDIRFNVSGLEHQLAASQAQAEQIEEEIQKKTIRTPFAGVVLERTTELGEWAAAGDVIAVLARDDVFDVIVNVPQQYLGSVAPGKRVPVRIADRLDVVAEVVESPPRGDVATRTFPIKLRVNGVEGLSEGMSAVVQLPTGPEVQTLTVPRDAVIFERGQQTITVVRDGVAQKVPVNVLGYAGELAGVEAAGLAEGINVVTKGHERLRGGEKVQVAQQ